MVADAADILVDARWLEPPEPMERVLEALDRLPPGGRIRFLLHREPYPLYKILRDMGYPHAVRPIPEGCYEILIHRPGEPARI